MFALTADHFETICPRQTSNPRQPFFVWLDLVERIYGSDAMSRAIELVENELGYGQDVGQMLYTGTPEYNLEVFNRVVEKIKNG